MKYSDMHVQSNLQFCYKNLGDWNLWEYVKHSFFRCLYYILIIYTCITNIRMVDIRLSENLLIKLTHRT